MSGVPVSRVRPATMDDIPFMWEMLYEAVHWPPGKSEPKPPRDELFARPGLSFYLEEWGRRDDVGFIAFGEEERIGATWFRRMSPLEPGYGFVDEDTPEVVAAVAPEHRGCGIGSDLLQALIAAARSSGYPGLSLSVERDNPAARLYERCGFRTLETRDTDLLMKLDLS